MKRLCNFQFLFTLATMIFAVSLESYSLLFFMLFSCLVCSDRLCRKMVSSVQSLSVHVSSHFTAEAAVTPNPFRSVTVHWQATAGGLKVWKFHNLLHRWNPESMRSWDLTFHKCLRISGIPLPVTMEPFCSVRIYGDATETLVCVNLKEYTLTGHFFQAHLSNCSLNF